MSAADLIVVLVTVPNAETAKQLAESLVESRLAACVSILPGVHSVYRWEGAIERADEIQLLIKTTLLSFPALESAIRAGHPYDTPEIIALRAEAVFDRYLNWARASVQSGS